jgi:hypothetical protein
VRPASLRALLAGVLALSVLAGCGDDGGLAELTADPVVSMDVPGASEREVRTDRGGRQLGKATPARVFRFLELDAGADPDAVFDATLEEAQEAGWTHERAGHTAERTARLRRTSNERELSLFVDLSTPPVLQLTLSTS